MSTYELAAGERWGGNYTAKGVGFCQALKDHCMNSGTHMPMLGDWAGNSNIWLQETGTSQSHQSYFVSRTNDWMLGHYLKFAQVLPHAFWQHNDAETVLRVPGCHPGHWQ